MITSSHIADIHLHVFSTFSVMALIVSNVLYDITTFIPEPIITHIPSEELTWI